jgi:hypothetical protein
VLSLYRLPAEGFSPQEVGGYWTAQRVVEPLERVELTDLVVRHAEAGIELRFVPSIWPWWTPVAASSLDFSGSRLHNATGHPEPHDSE